MEEYYRDLLALKRTQEGLIESGIIRATEALTAELSKKIENGGLTITVIKSYYNKLNDCFTALEKAKLDTEDILRRYNETIDREDKS
ncbi:MAG: hypothetical protein NC311_15295 [Muribaculaceae bacterium]|nr:hypothetical protein [Muribaculaceae bacterium]